MDWAVWDAVYISAVWGFIASVVLLIVVSLATQKADPPRPLPDMDGNPVDRKFQLGLRFRKSGHLKTHRGTDCSVSLLIVVQ